MKAGSVSGSLASFRYKHESGSEQRWHAWVQSPWEQWPPSLSDKAPKTWHRRRVTSAQNDIVSGHMSDSSFWESALADAMLARLDAARTEALAAGRRTPMFLDIGANVGSYSLSAAAHGHRVLAFEPLTLNAIALRRSLCRNAALAPLLTLHEKALAGVAREVNLNLNPKIKPRAARDAAREGAGGRRARGDCRKYMLYARRVLESVWLRQQLCPPF